MISFGQNEREVMRCRRHWMFYFWPVVITICTGGVGGIWLLYRIVVAYTDELIITNQKLHISRGIIAKDAHSIPLQKVNDVNYTQGVIGRMLDYGTVFFGSGNVASTDGFKCMAHPVRIKAAIENAVENQHDDRNKRLAGYIGDEIRQITNGH